MMKCLIVIVLSVLLCMFASVYVHAHIINPETGKPFVYKATSADVAPVVDGLVDDPAWKDAEFMQMKWDSLENQPWNDVQDFDAQFAAVWKSNTLYVAVQIIDDNIDVESSKLQNKDSLVIHVDVDHSGGKSELYKHTIAVKDDKVRQSFWDPFIAWDSTGSICELSFYLDGFLQKGETIGFGIYYNDVDNGHRENQIGWTPGRYPPNAKEEQIADLVFETDIKIDSKKLGTTWGNIKTLY